jgi:hypothetical protein
VPQQQANELGDRALFAVGAEFQRAAFVLSQRNETVAVSVTNDGAVSPFRNCAIEATKTRSLRAR